MSISEIADNKWEVEAAKPPVSTVSGIMQILLIAAFAGVFVYILQGSAAGIFGAKRDTMADNYGKMTNEAAPKK
jgi:hypothetical protein